MLSWDQPLQFEHTAVYFERGDYIVHNHHANGWVVVTPAEYHLVSLLRQGLTPHQVLAQVAEKDGVAEAEGGAPPTRQAVAKLIMRLFLYRIAYQGERPATFDPPAEARSSAPRAYFVCTNRCNLSCSYCYAESGPHWDTAGELTTAEALNLIDQVVDLGSRSLTFTGGEALTRPDLFTLAAHAKARGLSIALITNGAAVTPAKAEQIAALFDSVSLSLDSLNPEEHDFYRGDGAHAQAMRGLRLLQEQGIPIQINTTVTDKSVGSFVNLMDWTVDQGLHMKYSVVAEIGRGSDDFGVGWQENLALRDALRARQEAIMLEQARESGKGVAVAIRQFQSRSNCGHGTTQFSVDSYGNVYPCRLFHQPERRAGNVREQALAEIWHHAPVFNDPGYASADKMENCRHCTFRKFCAGGCRAIASGATGDYYAVMNVECPSIRRDLRLQMWQYFRSDPDAAAPAQQPALKEVRSHAVDG